MPSWRISCSAGSPAADKASTELWKCRAVESVESQGQAFPSFHEPLGNLTKGRRDFHIPTAPTTTADGKVENHKKVSHFPTAPISLSFKASKTPKRRANARTA